MGKTFKQRHPDATTAQIGKGKNKALRAPLILVVAAKVDEQSRIPPSNRSCPRQLRQRMSWFPPSPSVLAARGRRAMQRMTPKSNLLSICHRLMPSSASFTWAGTQVHLRRQQCSIYPHMWSSGSIKVSVNSWTAGLSFESSRDDMDRSNFKARQRHHCDTTNDLRVDARMLRRWSTHRESHHLAMICFLLLPSSTDANAPL
jgi:hypothetical protein